MSSRWHTTIKGFIGLATVATLTAACQSNTYYIKGEAPGTPDSTILYLCNLNTGTSPTLLDSFTVSKGRFHYSATTDSASLCRLYAKSHPASSVMLFIEPGNIYVELHREEGRSRVSGTMVNNQWQALNDTVAKYDARLRLIMKNSGDSISPRHMYRQVSEIYDILSRRIHEAALNNRDNAFGHFIATHWQQH